jgi:hypothetical protein
MEFLMLIAVGSLLALFAYALSRAWRNLANADAAPLLMLLGSLRAGQEEPDPEATAHALRRCTLCWASETCRQRLASGLPVPEFCPNAAFTARFCNPRPV